MQEGSEYVLTPSPKMSHYFIQSKLMLDNSASFTSSRMKDLTQWKVEAPETV